MSKVPHMNWVKTFEAAARLRSFAAAAEELNLTPAAVSQQIKLLEHHLGAALFLRLPHGVVLTEIGQAYAHPVRKSLDEIADATKNIFGIQQRARIRIHASASYATYVLAPQIAKFQSMQPNVDIQFTTAIWTDKFAETDVDIEVRFGDGKWSEGSIHSLGERYARLYCHPEFAERIGAGAKFEDFAKHAVRIIGSELDWPAMALMHGVELPAPNRFLDTDSSITALQIIAAGGGAAVVAEWFAESYVKQNLLVSPLSQRLKLERRFYLIVHEHARKKPYVDEFCRFLKETARAEIDDFE